MLEIVWAKRGEAEKAAGVMLAAYHDSSPQTSLPVNISDRTKTGKRIHIKIPSTLIFLTKKFSFSPYLLHAK